MLTNIYRYGIIFTKENIMDIVTISNSFTIFGSYTEPINNLSELIGIFNGYQVKTFKERMPDGRELNSYKFSFQNKSVTLRAHRLDIEFLFSPVTKGKDFLQYVKEVSAKLLAINAFHGHRIAFNSVEFVLNEDRGLIDKISSLFGVDSLFGAPAREVSLRLNHVKQIGNEEFNSILSIQDGMVSQNSTGQRTPAIFINKDINTVAKNTEIRFSLSEYSQYLLSMMLEAEQRTSTVIDQINK